VAALGGARQVLFEALVDVEEGDLAARHHQVAGGLRGQAHRLLQDLGTGRRQEAGRARLRDDELELFVGVVVGHLGHPRDAGHAHGEAAEGVERPDEREEDDVEQPHRVSDGERDGLGAEDGERLRRQLAQDHMQQRDDREGGGERDAVQPDLVDDAELGEQRLQEPGKRRLAHPSEPQAREGDAELGRRQVDVDVRDHLAGGARARPGAS